MLELIQSFDFGDWYAIVSFTVMALVAWKLGPCMSSRAPLPSCGK